ncbi:MFS transporter [Halomonas sp. AOP13-D3-9]
MAVKTISNVATHHLKQRDSISRMNVAALVIGHCAGLIDLVALPIWVGALITRFNFNPAHAGGLVTLFLIGAVVASLMTARNFHRVNRRALVVLGYSVAAITFFVASTQSDFMPLAVLHLIGGLANGMALSLVHGAMGRADNPHRLFAFAGIGLGAFGIVYMGVVPQLMSVQGGNILFLAFAAIFVVAAVAVFSAYPRLETVKATRPGALFAPGVTAVIAGVSLITFNQAMIFSFIEVIGHARSFAPQAIIGTLIALGIVNFVGPAPLAALLEKRLPARTVLNIGPAVQAAFALILTSVTLFTVWAPVAAVFVAVQIFTHTFAFGLLAKMDPTGRAVAATPAMLMTGSALGPIIGGVLMETASIPFLGITAVIISALSITCFARGTRATNGHGNP